MYDFLLCSMWCVGVQFLLGEVVCSKGVLCVSKWVLLCLMMKQWNVLVVGESCCVCICMMNQVCISGVFFIGRICSRLFCSFSLIVCSESRFSFSLVIMVCLIVLLLVIFIVICGFSWCFLKNVCMVVCVFEFFLWIMKGCVVRVFGVMVFMCVSGWLGVVMNISGCVVNGLVWVLILCGGWFIIDRFILFVCISVISCCWLCVICSFSLMLGCFWWKCVSSCGMKCLVVLMMFRVSMLWFSLRKCDIVFLVLWQVVSMWWVCIRKYFFVVDRVSLWFLWLNSVSCSCDFRFLICIDIVGGVMCSVVVVVWLLFRWVIFMKMCSWWKFRFKVN